MARQLGFRIKPVLRVVGVFVLLLIAAAVVWRLRFEYLLHSHLAPVRAAGLPTNGKELNKWYAAVPNSENAAVVMAEAFELIRDFKDPKDDWDASPSVD